jgi:hypothetical protein
MTGGKITRRIETIFDGLSILSGSSEHSTVRAFAPIYRGKNPVKVSYKKC